MVVHMSRSPIPYDDHSLRVIMRLNMIALAVKTLNPNTVRDIVFKLGFVRKFSSMEIDEQVSSVSSVSESAVKCVESYSPLQVTSSFLLFHMTVLYLQTLFVELSNTATLFRFTSSPSIFIVLFGFGKSVIRHTEFGRS